MGLERLGAVVFACWAPAAVVVLHALLGDYFGHEPYVDPVAHFAGGMAIAYFFHKLMIVYPERVGNPTLLIRRIALIGLAALAALTWELMELFSDMLFKSFVQFSAANTLRDLSLGVAGACVTAVLVARRNSSDQ